MLILQIAIGVFGGIGLYKLLCSDFLKEILPGLGIWFGAIAAWSVALILLKSCAHT